MYSAELIMSSLTVRDMIGLSVGKEFASAASNSGLNRSSTALNVSNAFRISVRISCTVWHALSSVDTLAKRLAMFVMRRFAAVRRTSTVCSRSDLVTVGVSHRAVVPLIVKIRDRSTVCVQITSGSPIVKTAIKYHQDTMSMFIQFNLCTHSNYCSVRLPVSTSSHGSYIVTCVISYYSCMQQGVDRHHCLVTMYSLFTDTGQEVLAPTFSTHNRRQLSHQLSAVTAST